MTSSASQSAFSFFVQESSRSPASVLHRTAAQRSLVLFHTAAQGRRRQFVHLQQSPVLLRTPSTPPLKAVKNDVGGTREDFHRRCHPDLNV